MCRKMMMMKFRNWKVTTFLLHFLLFQILSIASLKLFSITEPPEHVHWKRRQKCVATVVKECHKDSGVEVVVLNLDVRIFIFNFLDHQLQFYISFAEEENLLGEGDALGRARVQADQAPLSPHSRCGRKCLF